MEVSYKIVGVPPKLWLKHEHGLIWDDLRYPHFRKPQRLNPNEVPDSCGPVQVLRQRNAPGEDTKSSLSQHF